MKRQTMARNLIVLLMQFNVENRDCLLTKVNITTIQTLFITVSFCSRYRRCLVDGYNYIILLALGGNTRDINNLVTVNYFDIFINI